MMNLPLEQSHLNRYFELELSRLRALLKRRVLWLQNQWKHNPAEDEREGIVSDRHVDWLLAAADREAEQAFYATHPAAIDLTYNAESIMNEVMAIRMQLPDKKILPIDVLARVFALSDFERNVLILCAASEFDADFGPLFAYVQDNIKRDYPTMHLAYTIYGAPHESVRQLSTHFNDSQSLRRYRLIRVGDESAPMALRSLCLSERILDYLRGVNHLDSELQRHVLPMGAPLITPSFETAGQNIVQGIEQSRLSGSFPVVNLIGDDDAGQREVAAYCAEKLGIKLFELDPASITEPGLTEFIPLLERESLLTQAAYYIDLSRLGEVPTALKRLLNVLQTQTGVLIFISNHKRIENYLRLINTYLPKMRSRDRMVLWQNALIESAPLLNISRIVQQFRFGPTGVRQVVAIAANRAAVNGPEPQNVATLSMDEIWRACRQHSEWQLDDLAQRIDPAYTWDDLVLQPQELAQLHEVAGQVHYRHNVYVDWGYDQKLKRGKGISVLFSGASGTGKTMAAEVLANGLDLPLYRIDLAGVVNKYVGETEKNLRRIFTAAEESGTILFFDEADALFGKRTDVKDSHDRYANIEVNYLLQLMENYTGLAILATNRRQSLDRAFLRRLRFVIDFPFPTKDCRRRIWQRVFPEYVPVGRLDFNHLAQMEIAGGNIHTIALNAAFLGAADGGIVEMKHLIASARREYIKLDKLDTESMFGEYQ